MPVGVSRTRPKPRAYDFGMKLDLWLRHHGEKLPAFAKRAGVPYASLHRYMKGGTQIPSDRLHRVAIATELPSDYWMDDSLPYPPPAMHRQEAVDGVKAMLSSLPDSVLVQFLEMMRNPDDVRRTLELREAAKVWPRSSAPAQRPPNRGS